MKKMMMMMMVGAALFGAVQAWGASWSQMTLTYLTQSELNAQYLLDNDISTKWCRPFSAGAYVEFSASAGVPGKMELYAADDTGSGYSGRNWKSWTLYGWNGSNWVSINAWVNQTPTTTYGSYSTYTFSNSTAYPKYKLVLNANHGNSYQQMAELKFYTDTSRSSSTVECSSWDMVKANLEAGNSVKLTASITQTDGAGQWISSTGGKSVTLDLNGNTIGQGLSNASSAMYVIRTKGSDGVVKLTIKDSAGGGAIIGNSSVATTSGSGGGGFCLETSGSSLTLESGTLKNFRLTASGKDGGCIYVGSGVSFTMNGGTISDCTCGNQGGAVYCGGTFTMNGGTISGCSASVNGGGVYSSGTTKIYGGRFLNNSSKWGGALYASNTDTYIYVYGGYFSGNTASSSGPLFMGVSALKLGKLYGGVFADGDPTGSAQSRECLVLQDSATVTSVNSKYVVGKSISSSNGKLTGGTYTFDPAASEYVASGCCIAPGKVATKSSSTWTIGSASSTSPFQASAWNYAKINLEGGYNVKLTGNVNQDSTCTIPTSKGTMTLDLSGYTINRTASAQAFYVNSGNTFTIKNGTFDGKNFAFNADGHFLRNHATTTLDGVTIKNCKNNANNYWGTLFIPSGTLTMKGGRLQDCTTVGNGGGAYISGGTFIMTNGAVIASCTSTFTGDSAKGGGGVYVDSGTFTLADGTITSCTASKNGGGVYVNSGTMMMAGGMITNCMVSSATSCGGAVYNSGTFTMNSGTITGCKTEYFGGAIYHNSGSCTVNGGRICGNVATRNVSAIFVHAGTATVYGGEICDNKCYEAGAIGADGGTTTIYGGVMTGNVTTSASGDQYKNLFSYDGTMSVQGLVSDAEPSVANIRSNNGTVTVGAYQKVGDKWVVGANILGGCGKIANGSYTFCPTNAEYVAAGVAADPAKVTLSGSGTSYTVAPKDGIIEANAWSEVKAALEAGNSVKLTQNVSQDTTDVTLSSSQKVTLDLNGFTVTKKSNKWIAQLTSSNAKLTLTDTSSSKDGKIVQESGAAHSSLGGAICIDAGEVVIENGTYSGLSCQASGGFAYVASGAKLTMNGGVITNCTATSNGGAVYGVGTVTINGGVLTGNTASNGGAVFTSSRFEMFGGEISGNTVTGDSAGHGCGGGVAGGGTKVIYGGRIVGNTAARYAGGIFNNGGTLTVYGGTLSGNTAPDGKGGAIDSDADGQVTFYGGVVTDNVGGNFLIEVTNGMTVNGGAFDADPKTVANTSLGTGCVSTQVGSLYVVGSNVLASCGALVNGTYTFCPTNKIYSAAGVTVDVAKCTMTLDETKSPTNYVLTVTAGPIEVSSWEEARTALEANKNVKLTKDIAQGDGAQVYLESGQNVTLDLCGKAITLTTVARFASIHSATLTIADSVGGGIIDGSNIDRGGANGACIAMWKSDSVLNIEGGTIQNFKNTVYDGGAIYVSAGTAVMNGGVISNCCCTASNGGAFWNNGLLTINSGKIVNCSANGGGGVCVGGSGTLKVNGGEFLSNSANWGGALYGMNGSSFNVYGGYFRGNSATGGGQVMVYESYAQKCYVYGGVFDGYDPQTYGTDDARSIVLQNGKVLIGTSLYVIGSNALASCGALVNGTYTFCPTNEIYSAAGVTVDVAKCTMTVDETKSPTNYVLTAAQPIEVASWAELKSALQAGKSAKLVNDVEQINDGGIIATGTTTLDLNGHTITQIGVQRVISGVGTKLTITDSSADESGEIVGDGSKGYMWGRMARFGSGELVLEKGTIRGFDGTWNQDGNVGKTGGFSLYNSAKMTMNGGTIRDCKANEGAAVYLESGNTFIMNGGMISNCTTTSSGAAVMSSGTLTVNGGEFLDNHAGTYGGVFYCKNNSSCNVYGGYFRGNKANSGGQVLIWDSWAQNCNVYGGVFDGYDPEGTSSSGNTDARAIKLQRGKALIGTSLYVIGTDVLAGEGALVNGTFTFCPTNAEYVAASLAPDFAKCEMTLDGTKTPTNYVLTAAQPIEISSWSEVKAAVEAGKSVKLMKDISVGTTLNQAAWVSGSLAADVTLDLNGKTIDAYNGSSTAGEKERLFILISTSTYKLTIMDSVGGGSLVGHKQVNGHSGGMIYVGNTSQFVLNGGTISGFSTTGDGGAVFINNSSSFTMNGGTITNCAAAKNGGAICNKTGTFEMFGGVVSNCTATTEGGAIYNASTMTIDGGSILGCSAARGGAVYNSGTTKVYSGNLIGNKATQYSGACFFNGGSLYIYGGRIENNWSQNDGMIGTSVANNYIYGGSFHGNRGDYANLYVCSGNTYACKLYGGVFEINPTAATEAKNNTIALQDGNTVTKVGDNYVVGKSIAQVDDKLAGGTYTFCPTNAEYAAAGVAVADGKGVRSVSANPVDLHYIMDSDKTFVVFDAQSGTGAEATRTITLGDKTLGGGTTTSVPTRSGYVFCGYFTGKDGTGTQVFDSAGNLIGIFKPTEPATLNLYAYWHDGRSLVSTTPAAGTTLTASTVYRVSGSIAGGSGVSGLSVPANSTVYLCVDNGEAFTTAGGDASGMTGGGAGILLPSTSKLVIFGGGTLTATGGKGANGAGGSRGGNGAHSGNFSTGRTSYGGTGGAGGNGGGGAGAGIGGAGGAGGSGGAAKGGPSCTAWNESGHLHFSGNNGNGGSSGSAGGACGTVYVTGGSAVTATGAVGGTSGGSGGGAGGEDPHELDGTYRWLASPGGGGGSGAPGTWSWGIGGGGGGGGGGGSGGSGGTVRCVDWRYTNGGGGSGASGWANGGGTRYTYSCGHGSGGGGYGAGGGSMGSTPGSGTVYLSDGGTANVGTQQTGTTPVELTPTLIYMDCGATAAGTANQVATLQYGLDWQGENVTIPTRTGCNFGGYYTEQFGLGTQYVGADGTWMTGYSTVGGDRRLYAKWVAQIIINKEGEGEIIGAGDYVVGRTVTVTAKPIPGWTFVGWSDGVTDFSRTFEAVSNVTLTARFEENGGASECSTWDQVKMNLECGNNVKLVADVPQSSEQLIFNDNQQVTLDLNGYSLAQADGSWLFELKSAGCRITVLDSAIGGEIVGDGSVVSTNGGCVYISAGEFVLAGGAISGFKSSGNGGCVYVDSGVFTMTDGMITNCAAVKGGAVHVSLGAANLFGGAICGNAAESLGGGVSADAAGVLTVGGDQQIIGNTVNDAANNVELVSGQTVSVSTATPLDKGAKIGVTPATKSAALTGANAADVSDFFFSDDTTYYANNGADNAVVLALVGTGPTVKDKDDQDVLIEIPTEWRQEQKATPEEVMKPKMKMQNGMPAWQNYALGIEATNELSGVYADAPQNKATDKVTIETKNVDPTKVLSGYAIKYRLDKKLTGASEYTKGEKQDEPSFDVLLNDDDPSGVYKLSTVIIKDGVELDQPAEAVNTIGLVKATNTNKLAIVAVPWSRLAPGEEEEIAVSNVLKTATLEAGDKLHVFNRLAKTYDTWTLNEQKEWDSVVTYAIAADGTLSASVSGASATETIARGSGIWLERMNPTNAPYFLYGQVSASDLTPILPGHNLVGAPGVEAFDFSRVKGAAEGDQILVPGVVPKLYELKNGVWGYSKTVAKEINVKGTLKTSFKTVWTTDENTIPAGTGYWLINKSGSAITIE